MKCHKCGSTLPEDSLFCSRCGEEVKKEQVQEYVPLPILQQLQTPRKNGGVLLNAEGHVVGFVPAGAQSEQGRDLAVSSNNISGLLRQGARAMRLELLYAQKHPQVRYAQDSQYCVIIESFLFPSRELAKQVYEQWLQSSRTRTGLIRLIKEYGAEQRAPQEDYLLPGMWEEEFDQWAFDIDRSIGDAILYESEEGSKICVFSDADSQYMVSVKHISDYTDQLGQ